MECLRKAVEGKLETPNIDVVTIDRDRGYTKLGEKELLKAAG